MLVARCVCIYTVIYSHCSDTTSGAVFPEINADCELQLLFVRLRSCGILQTAVGGLFSCLIFFFLFLFLRESQFQCNAHFFSSTYYNVVWSGVGTNSQLQSVR